MCANAWLYTPPMVCKALLGGVLYKHLTNLHSLEITFPYFTRPADGFAEVDDPCPTHHQNLFYSVILN